MEEGRVSDNLSNVSFTKGEIAIKQTGTFNKVDKVFVVMDPAIIENNDRTLVREGIHMGKLAKKSCAQFSSTDTENRHSYHIFGNEIIEFL